MFITPTFDCQASYIYLNCPLPYLPINPATGKMLLPSSAKRIKLDIGLSHNAPNSEVWLRQWVVPLFAASRMFFAFLKCFTPNCAIFVAGFPKWLCLGLNPILLVRFYPYFSNIIACGSYVDHWPYFFSVKRLIFVFVCGIELDM